MSLSDLIAAERKSPGTKCTISTILPKLNKADAATLVAALASKDVTTAQLHRALLKAGHQIGRETVNRHRRGECSCAAR
jgi:ribulose bisphosphate carboxylase small subunit